MESELGTQSTLTEKANNITGGCEEILLPVPSLPNGSVGGSDNGVDFFENVPALPDTDPMDDVNSYSVSPVKERDDQQEQVEEEEELEEFEEAGEEDIVEEEEVVGEGVDGEGEDNAEIGLSEIAVAEEIDEDNEHEELEEEEVPVERTPTQVPKKRKDAALFAAVAEAEVQDEKNKRDAPETITGDNLSGEEQPTSSARATNKHDTVDEEQCRVCTSKEDLVSLFKTIENSTVADMLMTVCPNVSIAPKDFMPQFICNPCLDNATIAVQLKTQCESTEKELRKKLSRSKNKVRRPTGYVVIDAPVESDPSEEEEPNDEEYKVSDEASISFDDDSDDSDYSNKKKRVRSTNSRRRRRKSAITPTPRTKKKSSGRQQLKRGAGESTDDDGSKRRRDDSGEGEDSSDDDDDHTSKKKRSSDCGKDFRMSEFPCDECDQIFTRKASLVLHKKAHAGRDPINCEFCGKQFKIQGAYRTHLEKHTGETGTFDCDKCNRTYTSISELRRHQSEKHEEPTVLHQCLQCKRTFISEAKLRRHKKGRCPNSQTSKKNDLEGYAIGKDLFKSVAPLTTTYWSDSFSD